MALAGSAATRRRRGRQIGWMEGGEALSGHGAVAGAGAAVAEKSACVFTKRNLQLLPRFRRTVSAVPPRYALPGSDGGGRSDGGGGEADRRAGGRAKKEGAMYLASSFFPPSLPPSSIPYPTLSCHTWLSTPRTAIYLSVGPSPCQLARGPQSVVELYCRPLTKGENQERQLLQTRSALNVPPRDDLRRVISLILRRAERGGETAP